MKTISLSGSGFVIRQICPDNICQHKTRWARPGTGKSGGVRVIYFVTNERGEIVLLTLYAKSKTENLSAAKLKEIRRALEKD